MTEKVQQNKQNKGDSGTDTPAPTSLLTWRAVFAGFLLGAFMCGGALFWSWQAAPDYLTESYEGFQEDMTKLDWSKVPPAEIDKLLDKEKLSLRANERPLPEIKVADFVKNTPYGKIPGPSKDGATPFEVFKKPYVLDNLEKTQATAETASGKISLALLDYCRIKESSTLALDRLPGEISFITGPYCSDVNDYIALARNAGHEVWLAIPMEGNNYPRDDDGPLALLVNSSAQANQVKIQKLLSQARGYAGVATYKSPAFTASEADFSPILDTLAKAGLGLFETNTRPPSYISTYTRKSKIPYVHADIHLDARLTEEALDKKWNELLALAQQNGHAVGVFHASPLSINKVAEWTLDPEQNNIVLVPLSAQAGY